MQSRPKYPLLQIDERQDDVPPDLVAYTLRIWGKVFTGVFKEASVIDGRIRLAFIAHREIESTARPALAEDEVSRIFAIRGAEIDPAAFLLDAGEPPTHTGS